MATKVENWKDYVDTRDYCYECYNPDHLCLCVDDIDEKLVIGDWVFTKRGERVVMALATLILLTIMVVVGSIE